MIDPVKKLLAALRDGPCSPSDLRIAVGIKHRQTFRANYLNPAIRAGFTCAKDGLSPHDPNICYSLTDLGRRILEGNSSGVKEEEKVSSDPINDRGNSQINETVNETVNGGLNVLSSSERPIKRPIKPDVRPIKRPIKDVVFEIIAKNQGISRLQIARIIGKGITVTTQALSSLRQAGKIEHRGSKKTGGYYMK